MNKSQSQITKHTLGRHTGESRYPVFKHAFKIMFKAWIPAFAGMTALLSCLPKPIPNRMGDPAWGVDITWHGHSCFTLRDSLKRTIVIDPFDDTVGYGQLRLRADALLVTHSHFDHNEKRAVKTRLRDLELVESTGTTVVASDLSIFGIASYHDNAQGQIHGPNRFYTFTMGGLRFAHLGDVGQHDLTVEQHQSIGSVDVLFIPVGGFTTVDGPQAKRMVDVLKPKMVFPMHYGKTRFYPLADVQAFTSLYPKDDVNNLGSSTIRVRLSEVGEKLLVVTLKPTEKNY